MENEIVSAVEKAVTASDNLLAVIKHYKKYLMRRFLSIDSEMEPSELYKSISKSRKFTVKKLREIVTPCGIAAGPDPEDFLKNFYEDSGYPLMVPSYIKGLCYRPEKVKFVSKDAGRNFPRYIVKGGDIILSYLHDDRGASALVPFMQEESFLGTGLVMIRPDHGKSEVFYILNVLHFYYNSDILKMISDEHGGLNVEAISDLLVPLPPVQAQKDIAEKMLQLSAGMEAQEHYHKEMEKFSSQLPVLC